MKSRLSTLPKPIWTLGWVSFFTDAASETIYPLLPFFITHVLGGGPVSLGAIEGTAEATNSFVKVWSGRWSDRRDKRKPLVTAGYSLATLVRPLIAVASSWWHVFFIRAVDRFGKGLRGAPRDALVADLAPADARGLAFSVHRAMDHAGAVVGPLVASLFLYFWPGQFRTLFALTIVPGAVAVALLAFVHEVPRSPREVAGPGSGRSWHDLPPGLWRCLAVILVFTLGNSTDAFLLWRLSEATGNVALIPALWAALHVVKAGTSVVGGEVSDRLDRRVVLAAGWGIYAAVYAGFAMAHSSIVLIAWFLVYGIYFGLTEGVERAFVADFAAVDRRGTAFGVYNAIVGLGAFSSSLLFGLVLKAFGAPVAFGSGAALALLAAVLLIVVVPRRRP